MKKTTFFLIIAFGLCSAAFAQKKEMKIHSTTPSAVENAFHKEYPGVKAKWEKEGAMYEANFTKENHKMSRTYNANGMVEETEIQIHADQLPAGVKSHVSSHKLGEIKEASKITKADGTIEYEAEVKDGDAIFNSKGAFIKMQKH